MVEHSDQRGRVAADATGVTTAKLPVHTSADPAASARTKGAPKEAAHDSAAPDDPMPATAAHKSDDASAKGGDASTVGLPAPGPIGSVTQPAAGPTIPASGATPTAPVPALAPAPSGSAPAAAASQPAAIPATADAAPATGLEAALAGSVTTPAATTPEPNSLPVDPTLSVDPTAQRTQAAALGSTPAEPTSATSAGDKASNDTVDSDDVGVAKPTQALASAAAPMAGSGTASESPHNAEVHIASAAGSAANGTNHADATLAGGAHVDPPGDGAASPSAAAGPSGSALAQSAAPPVSANSALPTTAAPMTAAPATPSPSSSAAVPISGLAIEIAARATADEKSFQIRLDPPELGRIDVQLNVDASGHVTTHLTADRPETLNLLRQDASSLQRALESTGLKASSGGLEFSLRNQSFGGQTGGQRGGQSNGTTSPIARIVVPDEDMPAGQTATRGYARLLGVGAGVDIRV